VDRLVGVAALPAEVVLTRTHGDFGRQIAEYALGALLHHAGAWARLAEHQAAHEWARVPRTLLAGRRAGVLGLGVIGGEVAGVLRAAGLEVWGWSARGRAHPGCDRVFGAAALGEFLAGLDFAVLCLPLTRATRGLLGEPELSRLKPGAVLVNVARADVIEERALRAALANGRVAAAYLDVMWQEPLPADSPWWGVANAFVTPHLAGVTHTEALADEFGENLRRHLSGAPLHGMVDRARGY
jgi:phosphoglycerate dehydrogenase-like enzyme